MRWLDKWAIVTANTVPVFSGTPPMPGQPDPPGFHVEDRAVVRVMSWHRSRSAAEKWAPYIRTGLLNAGRIMDAHNVQVWDRASVEEAVEEWRPIVKTQDTFDG